jgi:hypothetical protein
LGGQLLPHRSSMSTGSREAASDPQSFRIVDQFLILSAA